MSNVITAAFSRGTYADYRRGYRRSRLGGYGGGVGIYRYRPDTTLVFHPNRSYNFDQYQPVFGYFAGGGFAFGIAEWENHRVPADFYDLYFDTKASTSLTIYFVNENGTPNGESRTINVGSDVPLYSELLALDVITWLHDKLMQQARQDYFSNEITESVYNTQTASANAALQQAAATIDWDAQYALVETSGLSGAAQLEARSLIAYQEFYAEALVRGLVGLAAEGQDPELVARHLEAIKERLAADRQIDPSIIQDLYDEARLTQGAVSQVFGFAGEYFGSQLGNYIVGNQDDLGEFVAASFINSIGADFGRFLAAGIGSGQPVLGIVEAFEEVGDAFGSQFSQRFRDGVVGGVSAFLTLELGEALGLEGFGAELFNTVGGTVVSHFVDASLTSAQNMWSGVNADEALTSADILGNLPNALAGALGAFIGTKLGSLVIEPTTQAGIVLSGLGSAGGAALGMKLSGGFASFFGGNAFLGLFAATGVGAFVGFVLGAFIGNLFGAKKPKIPTADAETVLNFNSGYYQMGAVAAQNGGNEDLVRDMAQAARDTLNGLIAAVVYDTEIAGNANMVSPTQVYGHTGGQLWVKLGSTTAAKQNVASADVAVDKGVLWAIDQTKITGGDLFMKRAIANSRTDSVLALAGDLTLGRDYGDYLHNRDVIDDAISAPYQSLSASDKTFYDNNQARFTRVMAKDSLPLSASDNTWYSGNQTRVDQIISDLAISQFAAGWIITLQRAAELGLNRTSVSDFYGGFGGFVDSLKILSGLDFDNEDVAFAFDGTALNVDYGRWSAARPEDNLMRGGDLSLGVDLLRHPYDWGGTSRGAVAVERLDDGSTALTFRDDDLFTQTNSNVYGTRWELSGGDIDGGRHFAVEGGDYVTFGFESRQLGGAQNRLSMKIQFFDASGAGLNSKNLLGADSAEWETNQFTIQADAGAAYARVYFYTYGSRAGDATPDDTVNVAARNIQFNRSATPFAEMPDYSAPVYERFTLDDFLVDGGFNAMSNTAPTSASQASRNALTDMVESAGRQIWGPSFLIESASFSLGATSGTDATGGNDIHISTSGAGVTIDDIRTETVTINYTFVETRNWAEPGWHWATATRTYTWSGGDDIFIGGAGNDTIYGRDGYDWLSGGDGDDVIYGGSEDDVILGGGGMDRLYGEDGDDYIAVGAGRDYNLNGVAYGAWGGNGNDTLVSAGGDQVYLHGDNGDDLLITTGGNQAWSRFDGGAGNDTLSFERDATGIVVSFGASAYYDATNTWRRLSSDTDQLFINIENLTGTEFADDLTGDDGANVLRGLGGDDILTGGAGHDTLEGGRGADTLIGNGGNDIASYKHSSSAVWVDLDSVEMFGGDAEGDSYSSIERLIGSDFDDTFFSKAGQANRLWGGRGDDWFVANGGTDYFYGDADFDTVDYADMTSAVTVNLAANSGGGAAAGNKFYDIEHIVGTDFADNITADGHDNYLQGGKGNDTLTGGAGLDTYVYNFGDGQDVIVEAEDTGGYDTLVIMGVNWSDVTLNFPNGDLMITLTGGGSIFVNDNQANWSVEGTGIDAIDIGGVGTVYIGYLMSGNRGGDFADTLYSTHNHGNIEDIIMGRAGADMIYSWRQGDSTDSADNLIWAGRDNDTIRTGSGDDTFIYDRGDGVDTIYDSGGYDRIQFGPSVYADDVIYEVVGNDLVIGLRDEANPEYTASQVADRLIIKNAGRSTGAGSRVEYITAGGVDIDINKLGITWTPSGGTGGPPGDPGDPDDPGGPGDPNWHIPPVVFDLGGDGLDLVSVNESRVVYDAGNGSLFRVGWVGASDGILTLDRDGDGIINNRTEISFVGDFEGATTDLEGLQGFDSNADGVLDAQDAMWGEFRIWQDVNQNGVGTAGELMSLEEAGIVSLNLTLTSTGQESGTTTDSISLNTAIATRADGTTLTAHDVALRLIQARAEGSALPGAELWDGLDWSTNGTFGVAHTGEAFDPANLAALMSSWTVNDAGVEGASWTTLFQHIDLDDLLAAPVYQADPNAPQTETFGVKPIVIDMDGDGIELINPGQSPIEFDANGDGALDQIGWVSSDDAILGLDRDGDGLISGIPEISFVDDVAGAQTDLEGLRAFDSNADGWLDAGDERYGDFRIWVDGNYDAVSDAGELRTLAEVGLDRLSLTSDASTGIDGGNLGNTVFGLAAIVWAEGSVGGMAGDVELRAYTGSLEEQLYDAFMREMLVQQDGGAWGFDRDSRRSQMMDLRAGNAGDGDAGDQPVVPLGQFAHSAAGKGLSGSAGAQQGLRGGMGTDYDPNAMLAFNGGGAGALAPDFAANDGRGTGAGFAAGDMQRWWLGFAGEAGSSSMGPRTLAERLAALDASREQVGPAGSGRAGLPQQDAGALAEQQRFLQAMAAFNGSSGVATLRKGDQVSTGQYNLFASRSELSSQADANKLGMYG